MDRFLTEQQRDEINETLENLGVEYGIPLKKFDNIMLSGDPMTIIYNHEVVGLCKSEITTKYFEDGDKDALRECMREAVLKLREQLAQKNQS
ncbi:MAG: hypothetical protein ACR2N3_12325 [Pyrinomonadaceae bacterium]